MMHGQKSIKIKKLLTYYGPPMNGIILSHLPKTIFNSKEVKKWQNY